MNTKIVKPCDKCNGAKAFFNPLSQDVDVCPGCDGYGHTDHMFCGLWGTYECQYLIDQRAEEEINSDDIYQNEKIEGVLWGTAHDPSPYENWRI